MKSEKSISEQTIEYTHTTVPTSMRSPYWKYFGFPSYGTNKILTRQKIICTLCGTAISYNKNTSNLRTHLIARHPEQLHEIHQHQQQSAAFSIGSGSDSITSVIPNKTVVDEKNIPEIKTLKRADSSDQNVSSTIKIRRLNAACQEPNNCVSSSPEDGSLCKQKHIYSDDLKSCMPECHSQNTNVGAVVQQLGKQSHTNDANESIIMTETGYVFLSSESIDNLQGTGEKLNKNDRNIYNDDKVDNDVAQLTEREGILNIEISEKPMFDYCSDTSSPEKRNESTLLNRNTPHIGLLAEMLVKDLLPFNVLQGTGFKQLLNSFGIADLDKYAVEKRIISDFTRMQQTIKNYIATSLRYNEKPYSLCIETCINNEEENIFSIYVNFLNFDSENKLESILYEDIVCNKETELYDILQDFDLSLCAAIVTTNMNNSIINNFCKTHGIDVVPCIDALLTQCIKSIFEQELVTELFYTIRKLSQNFNLTELDLHCPWSKLKLLQDFLDSSVEIDDKISSELEPFVDYINPLKIAFDTIRTEHLPLCTLVRPLMIKLFEEHFMIFNTDDNVYIQVAQKALNSELLKSIEKCEFLSEAVLFDLRFQHDFIQLEQHLIHQEQHKTAFLDRSNRTELVAAIRQRFQHLILTSSLELKTEQQKCDTTHVVQQSNLRLFFDRISDAAGATNRSNNRKPYQPKDPTDVEFNRYKCEQSLDLEQCPIDWWHLQSKQYKMLYKFAQYYLCVPCYALRWPQNKNDKIVMKNANMWRQKRRTLRYQQPAEKCLWYLHYNNSLYNTIKAIPSLIERNTKEV